MLKVLERHKIKRLMIHYEQAGKLTILEVSKKIYDVSSANFERTMK